jgi:histidinol-phosphate aminotransferase
MRLSALRIYTTDAHANFLYLPPEAGGRGRPWPEVFAGSKLQVRHYPDGGARITVGNRASTLAVVSAVGKVPLRA